MRIRLAVLAALCGLLLLICTSAVSSPPRGSDASTTVRARPILVGATSGTEAKPLVPPARGPNTLPARRLVVAPRVTTKSPSSSPTSPPIRHDYQGSVPALIRSIWGSAADCALRIAYRESRFNPRAYNPSGAAGLFQLMRIWYAGRWHFDPFSAYLNTLYAHRMYLEYGFGPWGGCP